MLIFHLKKLCLNNARGPEIGILMNLSWQLLAPKKRLEGVNPVF
jgi:hypothetical protein